MDNNTLNPDLLSDLPLGIIHGILSLVPIRDAVRTSLLSRKWRYVWSSLPRLAFDDTYVESDSELNTLFHFINQALLLHNGPILEFRFLLFTDFSTLQCPYIDQWLLFLSRNDIRILYLNFDNCYVVHSSVYSCQYLTHLTLQVNTIPPPPPSFNGFMFLRSLYISVAEGFSSTIESIVARSPLLEELRLDYLDFSEMTICAPNLKYLRFSSVDGHLSLRTPLLQKLKGYFDCTTSFSIGVEPLVFHHLTTIELHHVPFYKKEVTPAVIRLIMGSPNLQKLEIDVEFFQKDDPPKPACFLDDDSVPKFTYNSLRVIKIKRPCGHIDEMKLIEFLLARSPVLETLIYMPFVTISDNKVLELSIQLLSYCRASAKAQILIRYQPVAGVSRRTNSSGQSRGQTEIRSSYKASSVAGNNTFSARSKMSSVDEISSPSVAVKQATSSQSETRSSYKAAETETPAKPKPKPVIQMESLESSSPQLQ